MLNYRRTERKSGKNQTPDRKSVSMTTLYRYCTLYEADYTVRVCHSDVFTHLDVLPGPRSEE